jgi:hypothetical protein
MKKKNADFRQKPLLLVNPSNSNWLLAKRLRNKLKKLRKKLE